MATLRVEFALTTVTEPDTVIARAARLYHEGLTQSQIADTLGVHQSTILKYLDRAGVQKRPRAEAHRLAWERRRAQLEHNTAMGLPAQGPRWLWTSAEDQLLIANPDKTAKELASQLGRTVGSVHQRRFVLRQAGKLDARCNVCGRRHPNGTPAWLARAVKLYTENLSGPGQPPSRRSCAQVAEELSRKGIKLNDTTVHAWLRHEGVARDRATAARFAALRRGQQTRPPVRPAKCQCSPTCQATASGRSYRGTDGRWRTVTHAPGHRKSAAKPSQIDRGEQASRRLAERVERERLARGWSCARLFRETGRQWGTSLDSNRPPPETVYRFARVLGIDVEEAFDLAAIPRPSPLGWLLLHRMDSLGECRADIVRRAGVSKTCMTVTLTQPHYTPSDVNLDRLVRAGYLTPQQCLEVRSQRRQPAGTREGVYAPHTKHVTPSVLRNLLLSQSLSVPDAAARLGVSTWVVYSRLDKWGLRDPYKQRCVQTLDGLPAPLDKRTPGRQKGTRQWVENAESERKAKYWPVFEKYATIWPNLKTENVWRLIVQESEGTKPTADKAYKEWLLSSSGKEAKR